MKKIVVLLISFMLMITVTTLATDYPADWKSWTSVPTILTQIGALPACDADVSTLPEIYQESVYTYCDVQEGGPGKVAILVRPEVTEIYKSRSGKHPDGINLILHLVDMKILFVTRYEKGSAVYEVFTEDGKKITAPTGPLSKDSCNACHIGYSGYCINGQCGTQQ